MLKSYYYTDKVEAGCDEAGRGCLAGPVYAAAVILPRDYRNELLNDSKQLSAKERCLLREIIQCDALAWAVGVVSNQEIDRVNILRASILAMQRAADVLQVRPEALIIDGNRFLPYFPPACGRSLASPSTPEECFYPSDEAMGIFSTARRETEPLPYATIVKGDGKYLSIAAASILAKTYRDDFMARIHREYPMYQWDKNKGYPTKAHREAVRLHGATPYHRMTFNLLGSPQLEFDFG